MPSTTPISNKAKWILWGIHLMIFCAFMWRLILAPQDHMISGRNDGLKNYFTLQSYLQQPEEDGYIEFTGMQYPYGDAVWYTDNSPFIAMPLRFIQLHIANIAPYSAAIIQWIFLLNLLIAPLVLIPLLRRFISNEWLIVIGAIICIWTSPQFFRFFVGNMNLSLSTAYFLVIWLLLLIYDDYKTTDKRKLLWHACYLAITIFIAAGIHLYYILLLGLPAMVFLGIMVIAHLRSLKKIWSFAALPMVGIAVAVGIIMVWINTSDPWRSMRPVQLDGSNISAWEVRFLHLYKAKEDLNPIPFLGGKVHFDPENGMYLGGFFWYVLTIVVLYMLFMMLRKKNIDIVRSIDPGVLGWILIVTTIIVYFSGTGMRLHLPGRGNTMDNYLNPLYYAQKFVDTISQFRCIARMGWWVFYIAQIGLLVLLERVLLQRSLRAFQFALGAGIIILIVDMFGIHRFQETRFYENFFAPETLGSLPEIDTQAYQAILPIPYYHVGSEEYDFTIDDDNDWSRYTYQLQLHTNLPLMSVKLSRTPQLLASQMAQFLLEPETPTTLHAYLNKKPILVIYDPSVEEKASLEPAATVLALSPALIESQQMVKVAQHGNVSYYAWHLK